ncbi:ATP-dependent RNA helicase RhlE [Sinobacterium caligoides]|uniref:ATP-dependent RNA helicase RhlE n=1 Tax=Sinobacterium caligoides TaxID=933926 RepID=A0A3N2DP98_9GAMM|nr:DEAD/DEAH box helicase [Sinobacterium caligoides]ROS01596.1 ATP-dependent RNA helicase RhlE [Sinobacterium caligoides]
MSFADLGLSAPILKAVAKQGYDTPSPIQAAAIPAVLEGRDVMAAAQTGTGKTAGFTLPILEKLSTGTSANPNQVRALILTPTRELAAQIAENVEQYGANLTLRSTVVFGGVKINPQMMKLRRGVDILIATPGRLLDLYNQKAVRFDQLEILVLDEADRMLDMGFIHDIKKILAVLPKRRQNLLFSATFSDDIRNLARGLVNDPVEVSVAAPNSTADRVEQCIYPVDKKQKTRLLIKLILDNEWQQVLVFSRTKHGANRISKTLEEAGISSAPIHGNKSQAARTKALAGFKYGKVRVLVATDIAARGIDIDQLPQVVNFDLPNVAEDYVHRIGRTGRAGASGCAVSLVSNDEEQQLSDIERLLKRHLERHIIDGFKPVQEVAETNLSRRQKKPKKARTPREHHDGQRSTGSSNQRSRHANERSDGGQRGSDRRGNSSDGESGEGKRPSRAQQNRPGNRNGQKRRRPQGGGNQSSSRSDNSPSGNR